MECFCGASPPRGFRWRSGITCFEVPVSAISWRFLQIADSAFPAGGFAHSGGLEAATHLGEARTADRLDAYVRAHLWNAGNASLPFVAGAYDGPKDVWAIDRAVDAFLTNHVANRASRTQGRAFAATCARVFDEPYLASLAARTRTREVTAHFAPLFGASLAAVALARREALSLFLYIGLRGLLSAAVRLALVGTHEAQRLLDRHTETLDLVLDRCGSLRPSQAATSAPLVDVYSATHDRLYVRLFQS
jgi:urease accessory protein